MAKRLEDIIADGGEGVVLRKPKSFYEQGRSPSLLKIKVYKNMREVERKEQGKTERWREELTFW